MSETPHSGAAGVATTDLLCTVCATGQPAFAGITEEIAGDTARISFARDATSVLPLGSAVSITFESTDPPLRACARGRVLGRNEVEDGRHYLVKMVDADSLRDVLPTGVLRRQNRRSSERVRIDPARPARMAVSWQERSHAAEASLMDISVGGAGFILLDGGIEEASGSDDVVITIELPDAPRWVTLTCEIGSRCLVADGVRYGVRFVPERTPGFEDVLPLIERYVAARCGEILAANARQSPG